MHHETVIAIRSKFPSFPIDTGHPAIAGQTQWIRAQAFHLMNEQISSEKCRRAKRTHSLNAIMLSGLALEKHRSHRFRRTFYIYLGAYYSCRMLEQWRMGSTSEVSIGIDLVRSSLPEDCAELRRILAAAFVVPMDMGTMRRVIEQEK